MEEERTRTLLGIEKVRFTCRSQWLAFFVGYTFGQEISEFNLMWMAADKSLLFMAISLLIIANDALLSYLYNILGEID